MIPFSKCYFYFESFSSIHLPGSPSNSATVSSLWQTIIISLFFISTVITTTPHTDNFIEGIVGETTKLRCKPSKHLKNDSPVLVLWYKDGARLPFFTLDLRDGGPNQFFDDLMRLRVRSDVTGEFLTFISLLVSDSGYYKCKIDYQNSPSLEAKVQLIVYEPPRQLWIQHESKRIYSGQPLSPINQGSSLQLFCIAIGGKPIPQLSWWMGTTVLADKTYNLERLLSSREEEGADGDIFITSKFIKADDFVEVGNLEVRESRIVSELNIVNIKRKHSAANITCIAENNNISTPLRKTVTLNVYLRPDWVNIIKPERPLIENVSAEFKCETSGSNPPAKITWIKTNNGQSQVLESKNNIEDGTTISWLNLKAEAEDHRSVLTCRARNPSLPGKGSHNSTVLDVQFAPRVNLHLGKNLIHRSIKEGEDVYFDCDIAANPRKTIITWHKDDEIVEQNLKAGILLSGENLVLQRINRSYSGNYTCSAVNVLGRTKSNGVELPVMYLPVCSSDPVTIAVAENERVRLECRVNSLPSKDLKFIWLFNNTLDTVEVGTKRINIEGPLSFMDYTPLFSRDYGTLLCWATNEVGMQAEPCKFTIIETGPPERVKNCALVNHTVGNLEVRCSPGSNGGSTQRFVAKVFAASTHTLLSELRNKVPIFHVTGLATGQDYLVTVTAVNNKGSSLPQEIDAIRLKVAEKRMGDVKSQPVSPLVGVFLGLVGGFLLLLLVGLLLSKARSNRRLSCWSQKRETESKASRYSDTQVTHQCHQKVDSHLHPKVSASSPISRTTLRDEEEDSPDLVKSSNETSQLINSKKCPDMITRRHTYIPSPDTIPSSVMGSNCNGSARLGGPFTTDPQSPINLPGDESFV